MDEDRVPALLHLLQAEDRQSLARVARRLGIGQSELRRLLAALGDDAGFGGLGLVRQERDGERILLSLSARGRALCGRP